MYYKYIHLESRFSALPSYFLELCFFFAKIHEMGTGLELLKRHHSFSGISLKLIFLLHLLVSSRRLSVWHAFYVPKNTFS